ncbi:MAG: DUF4294 domain-containing protein [Bacteroidales bacterium]|nr:DUF4294 domain-containing protein [Bacteroidales bacterium]
MMKHIANHIIVISFVFFAGLQSSFAQENTDSIRNNPFIMTIQIEDGDTVLHCDLKPVTVIPEKHFANKREEIRYNKLMRNVIKVYPLAKTAGELLESYAPILDTLPTKKARDTYFDIIEKELWTKYGNQVKNLTSSQGIVLIKLIDRECSKSSYQVIKDFRGGFSAFFYQAIARLWGYNLKSKYDAEGEDKEIEEIVLMIESGII